MSPHIFDEIDLYVLGALDESERVRCAEHLAACSICRAEFDRIRVVSDVLPHALEHAAPPAALRDRILLATTTPARVERRTWFPRALVAALALAVGLDLWLATSLVRKSDSQIALVTVTKPRLTAAPQRTATPVPRIVTVGPTRVPTSSPASPAPIVAFAASPTPTPSALARASRNAESLLRLERENHELGRRLAAADARALRDGITIARLSGRLAPLQAALRGDATAVVAALASGQSYAAQGTVGGEAWRTIVLRPSDNGNALIVTRAPSAPEGLVYQAWVRRGGRYFHAGVLPPSMLTTLEMPMALETGDVVGFSREGAKIGGAPASPLLMEVTI